MDQSISMIFSSNGELSTGSGMDTLNQIVLTGKIETRLRAKAGNEIPVLFSGGLMKNKKQICGTVCVALNIQDRKITERYLAEANRELKETQAQLIQSAKLASIGELSAGIAHELNQPLMVIRTNAQLLARQLGSQQPDISKLIRYSAPLDRNTKRMMDIINHLRSFSRQTRTEYNPIDMNTVVRNAFMMISAQLRIHGINVTIDTGQNLPCAYGNSTQLEQVMLNLITNARDAIMDKFEQNIDNFVGEISVTTRWNREKAELNMWIKDNGVGISPRNKPQIFDPFFTTKDVGKGTGLGLSISYGIIQDHRGSIEVNQTDHEGTTFFIRLPVDDKSVNDDCNKYLG